MKHWKHVAALSTLLLAVTAVPAGAVDADGAVRAPTVPGEMVVPIKAPVDPVNLMRVTGPVTYVDLEGGFYAVGGLRLIGDNAEFAKLLEQEVVVTGTEFTGISFQMVPAINVVSIQPAVSAVEQIPVSAERDLPWLITVNGQAITSELEAVVLDGLLLVPLRGIVEAAGGKITWDGETQSMVIRMPDRTVHLAIGDGQAEVNEDGVYYFTRNLIQMAAPARIFKERTLISADTLTSVFGLYETKAEVGVLSLTSAQPVDVAPDEVLGGSEEAGENLVGSIREVKDGRILVEGPAMSNGEPMLIWLSVTESTEVRLGATAGTLADLPAGARVVVQLSGPVLESYPAQGGAASIQVIPADSIKGSIVEVESGRILVEGAAVADGEPNLLWLFITEQTRVEVGGEPVTGFEFAVGQQVEAEYSGPMLLSYPGQVAADLVRVVE